MKVAITGVLLCILTACASIERPSSPTGMAHPVNTLPTAEMLEHETDTMFPEYWKNFVTENNILGKTVIKKGMYSDGSSDDIYVDIFDQAKSTSEATDDYPGLAVAQDGYVPVASPRRSGDPYFINVNEGEGGSLYLIDHVSLEKEVVLTNYKMILKFPIANEQ